ncbi:MAG: L-histidine N(alpha)-methyltransferase, partial [Miltoncostaeaceae bacterium]
ELGSGASRKTEALLDAVCAAGGADAVRYVPFDVCPEAILDAAGRLATRYGALQIHGVAGDFGCHLGHIPPKEAGARLVAYLGGTIGNLEPQMRAPFLRDVAELLDEDDLLLVGTDLAGDPARIVPAYDDAQGVTAAFNLNLLRVLNRELGADFDLDAFEHVAAYEHDPARVEMRLRARRAQQVRFADLDLEVEFTAGEEMRTEISCKFTRETVAGMYADAGLELAEWHPDPRGWFAVSVARRA